jgi:hypothetical protein
MIFRPPATPVVVVSAVVHQRCSIAAHRPLRSISISQGFVSRKLTDYISNMIFDCDALEKVKVQFRSQRPSRRVAPELVQKLSRWKMALK